MRVAVLPANDNQEEDNVTETTGLMASGDHELTSVETNSPSVVVVIPESSPLSTCPSPEPSNSQTITADDCPTKETLTAQTETHMDQTHEGEEPMATDNAVAENKHEVSTNPLDLSDPTTAVDIDTDSVVSINIETKVEEDCVSRISSLQGDMCRICHCIAEDSETLISPCDCCGSMKWVHQKCLQKWVKSRDAKKCELCGFPFNMTSSVKPFRKWKKLNMSSVERRKVLCSVTFHVVAITCVIWSLYVLIDRTTQEIQQGNLNWPFWTKLVVVAIGFTGGLVFMYVQCKTYVKLFRRWKQFNRVIYINDVQLPETTESEANEMIDTSSNSEIPITNETVVEIRMPGNDGRQSV